MKAGALLQMVSFETGVACNLAAEHPECPNSLGLDRYAHLDQSRRLDEVTMIGTAQRLYEDYDFRGWINFSFYNEPLLHPDRLIQLAEYVKAVAPECPLLLITNGTRFPDDLTPFRLFQAVHVTDYGGHLSPPADRLQALRDVCPVVVNPGRLDGRLSIVGRDRRDRACVYPFQDLAFDHFGHAHLCCFDWRGLASPGNLFSDGLDRCLERWLEMVLAISGPTMTAEAPATCRTCRHRHFQSVPRFHAPARRMALAWLKEVHR